MITAVTPLYTLNDAALVQCCINKTPGAFNTLTKRYLKPVYSYIFHYVQNAELAEDLTQETFVRAYRSIHRFDPSRSLKPWLFAIATNVSKTALKQGQHQAILLSDEASEQNLLENLEDSRCLDEAVTDEAVCQMLQEALRKLPVSVRQAMVLRHVYDLAYDEVAEVMQANVNTVRTWLKRGRENLKTILEHHGGFN